MQTRGKADLTVDRAQAGDAPPALLAARAWIGTPYFVGQALRELPAASPFRLDPLEAGLIMASAGKVGVAHARGGL